MKGTHCQLLRNYLAMGLYLTGLTFILWGNRCTGGWKNRLHYIYTNSGGTCDTRD